MSVKAVSRFPKRWIITVAAIILLLGTIAILSQYRRVYTVSDALAKRIELNGRMITVRGYSLFFYELTTQLCQPQRCDCNQSSSSHFVLVDGDTFAARQQGPINTELLIEVYMLDCQGDECSMTCRPIKPETTNELELTGLFHYDPTISIYAKLDSVELDSTREKIGEEWLPITTGSFTIQLRQP
jgi:hypothetical protein